MTWSEVADSIANLLDLCVGKLRKARQRDQLAGRLLGDGQAHVSELVGEGRLLVVGDGVVHVGAPTGLGKYRHHLVPSGGECDRKMTDVVPPSHRKDSERRTFGSRGISKDDLATTL